MSIRPQVIHIHDAPPGWQTNPDYVYIGRAVPRLKLPSSVFRNQYSVKTFGREKAIALFRKRIAFLMENFPHWQDDIRALAGKTLVCWCKPEACHGDVLADLCEELNGGSA